MSNALKCVIDTNVCMKYFIPGPLAVKVDQLLGHLAVPETEIHVPDLFYIESANAFWKYVRAGQLTATQVQANLATLKALPFQVSSTANLMEEAVNIGLTYGITAYDACYVALSQQVQAPLLTLDERLVNALVTGSYDVHFVHGFLRSALLRE